MNEIIVPLSDFEISYRQKRHYLTLNIWMLINRSQHGSAIGTRHKHAVQNRLKRHVLSAMQNGEPIQKNTKFTFEWTFRDRRIDLDNWAFVHKFIFDCFQETILQNGQAFLSNDNLTYVQGLTDLFVGINKENPTVRITWRNDDE